MTARIAGRAALAGMVLLAGAWSVAGAQLRVPAATTARDPVPYPAALAEGERLLLDVEGEVRGYAPDPRGGIAAGALVATFAGGPPFLIGTGRLVWTAPRDGRLAFAVAQAGGRRLEGGYEVAVTPLGRAGDPRQRAFPAPRIAFATREPGGPLLELVYADRAGFGLDLASLRVVLDAENGERLVLSRWFERDATVARLVRLPPEVRLPPGVHRVTARIADRLGNVSPPATIFLDQP